MNWHSILSPASAKQRLCLFVYLLFVFFPLRWIKLHIIVPGVSFGRWGKYIDYVQMGRVTELVHYSDSSRYHKNIEIILKDGYSYISIHLHILVYIHISVFIFYYVFLINFTSVSLFYQFFENSMQCILIVSTPPRSIPPLLHSFPTSSLLFL